MEWVYTAPVGAIRVKTKRTGLLAAFSPQSGYPTVAYPAVGRPKEKPASGASPSEIMCSEWERVWPSRYGHQEKVN